MGLAERVIWYAVAALAGGIFGFAFGFAAARIREFKGLTRE